MYHLQKTRKRLKAPKTYHKQTPRRQLSTRLLLFQSTQPQFNQNLNQDDYQQQNNNKNNNSQRKRPLTNDERIKQQADLLFELGNSRREDGRLKSQNDSKTDYSPIPKTAFNSSEQVKQHLEEDDDNSQDDDTNSQQSNRKKSITPLKSPHELTLLDPDHLYTLSRLPKVYPEYSFFIGESVEPTNIYPLDHDSTTRKYLHQALPQFTFRVGGPSTPDIQLSANARKYVTDSGGQISYSIGVGQFNEQVDNQSLQSPVLPRDHVFNQLGNTKLKFTQLSEHLSQSWGLIALEDIPKGSVLASIPLSSTIRDGNQLKIVNPSTLTTFQKQWIDDLLTVFTILKASLRTLPDETNSRSYMSFGLHLTLLRVLGKRTKYHATIQAMPAEYPGLLMLTSKDSMFRAYHRDMSCHLDFFQMFNKFLIHTKINDVIRLESNSWLLKAKPSLAKYFPPQTTLFDALYTLIKKELNLRNESEVFNILRWGLLSAQTRTLQNPIYDPSTTYYAQEMNIDPGLVIFPFIEYINHSEGPNCELQTQTLDSPTETTTLTTATTTPVSKADQIELLYKPIFEGEEDGTKALKRHTNTSPHNTTVYNRYQHDTQHQQQQAQQSQQQQEYEQLLNNTANRKLNIGDPFNENPNYLGQEERKKKRLEEPPPAPYHPRYNHSYEQQQSQPTPAEQAKIKLDIEEKEDKKVVELVDAILQRPTTHKVTTPHEYNQVRELVVAQRHIRAGEQITISYYPRKEFEFPIRDVSQKYVTNTRTLLRNSISDPLRPSFERQLYRLPEPQRYLPRDTYSDVPNSLTIPFQHGFMPPFLPTHSIYLNRFSHRMAADYIPSYYYMARNFKETCVPWLKDFNKKRFRYLPRHERQLLLRTNNINFTLPDAPFKYLYPTPYRIHQFRPESLPQNNPRYDHVLNKIGRSYSINRHTGEEEPVANFLTLSYLGPSPELEALARIYAIPGFSAKLLERDSNLSFNGSADLVMRHFNTRIDEVLNTVEQRVRDELQIHSRQELSANDWLLGFMDKIDDDNEAVKNFIIYLQLQAWINANPLYLRHIHRGYLNSLYSKDYDSAMFGFNVYQDTQLAVHASQVLETVLGIDQFHHPIRIPPPWHTIRQPHRNIVLPDMELTDKMIDMERLLHRASKPYEPHSPFYDRKLEPIFRQFYLGGTNRTDEIKSLIKEGVIGPEIELDNIESLPPAVVKRLLRQQHLEEQEREKMRLEAMQEAKLHPMERELLRIKREEEERNKPKVINPFEELGDDEFHPLHPQKKEIQPWMASDEFFDPNSLPNENDTGPRGEELRYKQWKERKLKENIMLDPALRDPTIPKHFSPLTTAALEALPEDVRQQHILAKELGLKKSPRIIDDKRIVQHRIHEALFTPYVLQLPPDENGGARLPPEQERQKAQLPLPTRIPIHQKLDHFTHYTTFGKKYTFDGQTMQPEPELVDDGDGIQVPVYPSKTGLNEVDIYKDKEDLLATPNDNNSLFKRHRKQLKYIGQRIQNIFQDHEDAKKKGDPNVISDEELREKERKWQLKMLEREEVERVRDLEFISRLNSPNRRTTMNESYLRATSKHGMMSRGQIAPIDDNEDIEFQQLGGYQGPRSKYRVKGEDERRKRENPFHIPSDDV